MKFPLTPGVLGFKSTKIISWKFHMTIKNQQMKPNIIKVKSFDFAVEMVNLYKNLTFEKMNL